MSDAIEVLLVEDNAGDARLIEETVSESDGFHIEWVSSLGSALELLQARMPDVVLLDLYLPDSRGLETFTRLRAKAPVLPVVVLSGLDDAELALEAVRSGAQDYLVKGRVDGSMLARLMRYAIERKSTEEKLRRANERLKKLDEVKSNFISAASHELRTPLTSIKGYVAVVLQEKIGPLNAQQKEFLQVVKEATDRLHRLLDDLLDLSRIESGRIEMRLSLTDLEPLLAEEALIFRVQAEAKMIDVGTEIEPDLPKIYCDPDKIRQIVGNLLSNAIKYSRPGGRVTAAAFHRAKYVTIEVRDTGIGIAPEDQGKIFEPFQRLRRHEVEGEEGTGLGLVVVKRIAELHGGQVELESELGKGSVFRVILPIEKRAGAPA